MSLCIATGGAVLALVASSFSLSWTHSVEKTEWVEHWQVEGTKLALTQAKVQGAGAGVDVPEGAVWEGNGWRYTPKLRPIAQLNLAASGMTVGGWRFCTPESCMELGRDAGETISIWVEDVCVAKP